MPPAGAAKSRKPVRGQVCTRALRKGDFVFVPGAGWRPSQVGHGLPRCWAVYQGGSKGRIRVRPISPSGIQEPEVTVDKVELLDDLVTREALDALAAQHSKAGAQRPPAARSAKRKAESAPKTPTKPAPPPADKPRKKAPKKQAKPTAAAPNKKSPKRKKR